MSFTLWLTRSSPTVSNRPASQRDQHLGAHAVGAQHQDRLPHARAGLAPCRRTPRRDPARARSGCAATRRPIRCFAASALPRSTPAAAYARSVTGAPPARSDMGEVTKLLDALLHAGGVDPLEAADRKPRHGVGTHHRPVDHRAPHAVGSRGRRSGPGNPGIRRRTHRRRRSDRILPRADRPARRRSVSGSISSAPCSPRLTTTLRGRGPAPSGRPGARSSRRTARAARCR